MRAFELGGLEVQFRAQGFRGFGAFGFRVSRLGGAQTFAGRPERQRSVGVEASDLGGHGRLQLKRQNPQQRHASLPGHVGS